MHLQMIVEHCEPDVVVVRPVGDVDLATAASLRERLLATLEGAPAALVVALDRVDFLDSTGLGALVAGSRRASLVGTAFRVAAPARGVAKVLHITNMDRALAVYPSIADAVRGGPVAGAPDPGAGRHRPDPGMGALAAGA